MSTLTINQSYLGIENFSSNELLLFPQLSGGLLSGLRKFGSEGDASSSDLPLGALYNLTSDNSVRVKVAAP